MSKYILIEDECAPDAYETFEKEFKKLFGVTPLEWKKDATNISRADDEVRYIKDGFILESSADWHQWRVYNTTSVV